LTARRSNLGKRVFGLLEPVELTPKDIRRRLERFGDVKNAKRQL
jgi:hypothetical protein